MVEYQVNPPVCIIGLGSIGGRVARLLIEGGSDVYGVDRNSTVTYEFVRDGGITLKLRPPAAVCRRGILLTALPNLDAVRDVLLAPGRVETVLAQGSTVVDLSTGSRELSLELEQSLHVRGFNFVDGPVTAVRAADAGGRLVMFAGGSTSSIETIRESLGCAFEEIHHMGPVGMGSLTKLALQYLNIIRLMSTGEVLSVLTHYGLPIEKFLGLLPSVASQNSTVNMVNRWQHLARTPELTPSASLSLFLKDFRLALDEFRSLGIDPRLGDAGERYFAGVDLVEIESLDCAQILDLVEGE